MTPTVDSERTPLPSILLAILLCLLLASCAKETPADILEKKGFSLDTKGFHAAIQSGDLDAVKLFITTGVKFNEIPRRSTTALGWAILRNRTAIAKYLLSAGADVNAPVTIDDMSPLMLASREARTIILKELVQEGAAINARDNFGNTALLHSVEGGDLEILEFLLEKGAEPNLQTTSTGSFALGLAVTKDKAEMVKALLRAGAKPNLKGKQLGMTPLSLAAYKGNAEMVKILLAGGADPSVVNKKGVTALQLAQHFKHREVEALLR